LRVAYSIAAAALFLALPWGQAGALLLVLFMVLMAADLTAAAPALRSAPVPATSVVALGGDMANLALLRRTVPALRMRRPAAALDAQIRWRQAIETRRRQRDSVC
jgi:hypothetical protein